jgi:hypothetical protein
MVPATPYRPLSYGTVAFTYNLETSCIITNNSLDVTHMICATLLQAV